MARSTWLIKYSSSPRLAVVFSTTALARSIGSEAVGFPGRGRADGGQ